MPVIPTGISRPKAGQTGKFGAIGISYFFDWSLNLPVQHNQGGRRQAPWPDQCAL